jgi:hypothetical protein
MAIKNLNINSANLADALSVSFIKVVAKWSDGIATSRL